MILSEKYRVVEEKTQITLYEVVVKQVLDTDNNPTGEVKVTDKLLGNYSRTSTGRKQAYARVINCEISEVDTLQQVLDAVERCEQQVVEFWEAK